MSGGFNPFENISINPSQNDTNSLPNPFQGGGEVDVDELLKKIDAKIAELEEEERLEKEKGNTKEEIPIENKDMDKVLEEFKFDLDDAMKENNKTEEKQTANEANVAKTFNDILMENSNKEDIKKNKVDSNTINNNTNENSITDDQYFDDFFQDE